MMCPRVDAGGADEERKGLQPGNRGRRPAASDDGGERAGNGGMAGYVPETPVRPGGEPQVG